MCLEARADRADASVHHVGRRQNVRSGLRLHQRLANERLQRLVVGDLRAVQQAIMAVTRIGIEGDVEHNADVDAGILDRARRAADEVIGIERLARVRCAQLGLGVGKERDRRNAEARSLLGRGDDVVDRKAVDARHRRDRHALVAAFYDEEGPDQVGDAEAVLGDETAGPLGAPRAPQPHAGIGAERAAAQLATDGLAAPSGGLQVWRWVTRFHVQASAIGDATLAGRVPFGKGRSPDGTHQG